LSAFTTLFKKKMGACNKTERKPYLPTKNQNPNQPNQYDNPKSSNISNIPFPQSNNAYYSQMNSGQPIQSPQYGQNPRLYGQMNNAQPRSILPPEQDVENPLFYEQCMQDGTNVVQRPFQQNAQILQKDAEKIPSESLMMAIIEDEKTKKERMLEFFRQFALKFSISNDFAAKLRALGNFKVVFLCDDSGSMSLDAYSGEFIKDPFAAIPTRFQELSNMVKFVMDIVCVISNDPIDLYFLNRAGKQNAKSYMEVAPLFIPPPNGGTPMVRVLKEIINEKKLIMAEKNLLIFIATDGMPADDNDNRNFPELAEFLKRSLDQFPSLYVTFMACISEEELLKNMDKLGTELDRVGVVDEFHVEFKEMMEKHNNNKDFTFTEGDYLTKALLVAVDKDIKLLFKDEESEDDDVKKAEESDVVKKFKLK